DAAVLGELHRSVDQLESICERLVKSPDSLDPDSRPLRPFPTSYEEYDIVLFSSRLLNVKKSGELPVWFQLGAEVGKCQSLLRSPLEKVSENAASAIAQLLLELKIPGLESWRGFLDDCNTVLDNYGGQCAVSSLDSHLVTFFPNRPVPEPLLSLHEDRLVFLGVTRSLSSYGEREMALLWVLAERADIPVPRETIARELNIETTDRSLKNLKSTATRLRDILEEMARESSRWEWFQKQPARKMRFISGARDRAHKRSPYRLMLDPAHVRISGRPSWMNLRKGDIGQPPSR